MRLHCKETQWFCILSLKLRRIIVINYCDLNIYQNNLAALIWYSFISGPSDCLVHFSDLTSWLRCLMSAFTLCEKSYLNSTSLTRRHSWMDKGLKLGSFSPVAQSGPTNSTNRLLWTQTLLKTALAEPEKKWVKKCDDEQIRKDVTETVIFFY